MELPLSFNNRPSPTAAGRVPRAAFLPSFLLYKSGFRVQIWLEARRMALLRA